MKKCLLLVVFVLTASSNSWSQNPGINSGATPQPPAPAPKIVAAANAVTEYSKLLEKLKNGDTKIDFKEFRIKYTETDGYSAMGTPYGLRDQMFALVEDEKYTEARDAALKVLEKNYTDSNAHMVLSIAFRELNDSKKSDFHKEVYLGLMKSIENSGDGKSPKTAFLVISVPEEYALLSYLGLDRTKQALVEVDGSKYDLLTVRPQGGGESFGMYFNVDIVFKGYEKLFRR